MRKSRVRASAQDEQRTVRAPNLNAIFLAPEFYSEAIADQRRREIDKLVAQITARSRQRGRPRKLDESEEV